MEVSDENGAHRDNFLRAADSSDSIWRRRKAGKFGSNQGSRLLQSVSAALSAGSGSGSNTLELKGTGQGIIRALHQSTARGSAVCFFICFLCIHASCLSASLALSVCLPSCSFAGMHGSVIRL